MIDDDLLRYRREFPGLDRMIHLISHSLGAMPRGVRDRLREFADLWEARGIRAWEEKWWDMPVTTGNKVARILGAPDGSVVMHQNVSVAQSVLLSCFEFSGRRNKVVYSALNFPSVMYVHEARRPEGARIEMVPSDDGFTVPLERMLAAIDEETLLVPISHVIFKSGFLQDARAITEKAHRVGARVILDVYQSAGTVPLDVTALGVDFAVGGSVKWLCGGPGAGYLYVRPDLIPELRPKVTGWMAHAAPFAFEPGPIRYSAGVTRFLHGSPQVPCFYAAEAGYDLTLEIGAERIRAKSLRQTRRLMELCDEAGFPVRGARGDPERGGMVVVDVPHGAEVARELLRREILVDYRPGAGIRLSPHYYTSDDEIEHGVREIRSILEGGAWRRAADPAAAGERPI
jgi:kynureninase